MNKIDGNESKTTTDSEVAVKNTSNKKQRVAKIASSTSSSSSSSSDTEQDTETVKKDDGNIKTDAAAENGAKVIAGEVIRQWQTRTRNRGSVSRLGSISQCCLWITDAYQTLILLRQLLLLFVSVSS